MIERKNYNIGEWSEHYTLVNLLISGKLFAADENLEIIRNDDGDIYFPVLRILRDENTGTARNPVITKFVFEPIQDSGDSILVTINDTSPFTVAKSRLENISETLLTGMKTPANSGRNAILENVYLFLEEIGIGKIKQGSDKKADIIIQVYDFITRQQPTVGFSVKSFLGSPPTLVNASSATHFEYRLDNLSIDEIERINSMGSPSERYAEIFSQNSNPVFVGMDSSVFRNNLLMIDSNMPNIISKMILAHYSGRATSCNEVVSLLNHEIMTDLSVPEIFLEYNMKEFLCNYALGMRASKVWNGKDEASGGYIVVKNDGSIVSFYVFNKDLLKEFLYNKTKFEKPDGRIEYGTLYEKNGCVHIKLSLQIRFR